MTEQIRAEWEDWQERTLRALSRIATLGFGAVAIFQLLVQSTAPHAVVFLGVSLVLVVAGFAPLRYRVRAAVLCCAFQAAGLYGLLTLGGAANVLSAMCVAVIFATLLLGRRWGIAFAAFATATTLLVAVLYQVRALKPVLGFDPADGLSLFRCGLTFGVIAATMVMTVSYILRRAHRSLVEKAALVERLQLEQAAKERISGELRRRDEALRKARELELLGRLAECVAHDFNNALLIVQASAHAARRDPRQLETSLGDIDEAVRQAAATTRRLRAFRPQPVRAPAQLSMGEAVAQACALLGRIVPKNVVVVVDTDDAPLVWADEGRIQSIITNLVLNACDAMIEGGKMTVRARVAGGDELTAANLTGRFVAVEVADEGIGMSGETMARAFEPFFTTKGGGTGLGLASVKGAIEGAGGRIRVESTPGEGSTFTFYWPLAEVDATTSAAVENSAPSRRCTVLVVDDDDSARRAIVKMLECAGHQVLQASNGGDALAVARSHGRVIDVLCSNCVMPGMPVRLLVERFRATYPHARVLLCSGYVPEERLPPSGWVEGFLPKPFSAETLSKTIGKLVALPRGWTLPASECAEALPSDTR